MREHGRHLGGVRDAHGAEGDGLGHEGSVLHRGILMVVAASSGSAPHRLSGSSLSPTRSTSPEHPLEVDVRYPHGTWWYHNHGRCLHAGSHGLPRRTCRERERHGQVTPTLPRVFRRASSVWGGINLAHAWRHSGRHRGSDLGICGSRRYRRRNRVLRVAGKTDQRLLTLGWCRLGRQPGRSTAATIIGDPLSSGESLWLSLHRPAEHPRDAAARPARRRGAPRREIRQLSPVSKR